MKPILLIPCWIGIASYCILSVIAGPTGLVATQKTKDASHIMRENLNNLENLNATYANDWEILRTNPDAIVLEARSLGYIAGNEIAIRLSVSDEPAVPDSAGTRISFNSESLLAEKKIKDIALLVGLFSAIVVFALRLKKLPLKNKFYREIRTQAASRS